MNDDLPAEGAEEKLEALGALFARRNGHGIACNEAIDIATRAHAQLMEILERSGLDRSWLDEAAPPHPRSIEPVVPDEGTISLLKARMGKRFKSGVCAYCGDPGDTADHVFARTFFPLDLRGDIPQVLACKPCNGEKSKLEHYLATVLPFGGNHPRSGSFLVDHVPGRLARNQKLHRTLRDGQMPMRWSEEGKEQSSFGVAYDHDQMLDYLAYLAKGLVRAHWGATVRQDYVLSTGLVTHAQDEILRNLFVGQSANYARGNLGDGLILYEGQQGIGDTSLTLWRFLFYGGLKFGEEGDILNISRDMWAITAKEPMPDMHRPTDRLAISAEAR